MSSTYSDKQFTKDFSELTSIITQRLMSATSVEEVKEDLSMLETMANNPNSPATAKTVFGLAYLMDDKPWYDLEKGFTAVKQAAEDAKDNEPFCWFMLGSIYLNGKKDIPKDIVSAKYWIEKAATAGYKDAEIVKEIEWGDNPDGFKEWFAEKMNKDYERKQKLLRWLPFILILLIAGILLYFL